LLIDTVNVAVLIYSDAKRVSMNRDQFCRVYSSVIPPAICDLICEQAMASGFESARLYRSHNDQPVDASIRSAKLVMWNSLHWTAGLLRHYADLANAEQWSFVTSTSQGAQFAQYDIGDWFDWHKDEFPTSITSNESEIWAGLNRKLTIVLNLSSPQDYDGGELQFKDTYGREFVDPKASERGRAKGSIFVFPSYILHRVTKVTSGQRCSLTSWIVGPPFR